MQTKTVTSRPTVFQFNVWAGNQDDLTELASFAAPARQQVQAYDYGPTVPAWIFEVQEDGGVQCFVEYDSLPNIGESPEYRKDLICTFSVGDGISNQFGRYHNVEDLSSYQEVGLGSSYSYTISED